MVQSRLKKLVEESVQSFCVKTDGYISFELLYDIFETVGIFKGRIELAKLDSQKL